MSPVRGADETSWQQAGRTEWLSVATAHDVALFQIAERRDRTALAHLAPGEEAGV